MKIIIPISNFLLALTVFYLKYIESSIALALVKLYSIDAVNRQLRLEITAVEHKVFNLAIIIALISTAIAAVSIYNKLCNKIIGVILLLFSVLCFLCSLIRA